MVHFIYGKTTKKEVLETLDKNNYKLHEYDPRLCYNSYTYVIENNGKELVTRTYFFDEFNTLKKVLTN